MRRISALIKKKKTNSQGYVIVDKEANSAELVVGDMLLNEFTANVQCRSTHTQRRKCCGERVAETGAVEEAAGRTEKKKYLREPGSSSSSTKSRLSLSGPDLDRCRTPGGLGPGSECE